MRSEEESACQLRPGAAGASCIEIHMETHMYMERKLTTKVCKTKGHHHRCVSPYSDTGFFRWKNRQVKQVNVHKSVEGGDVFSSNHKAFGREERCSAEFNGCKLEKSIESEWKNQDLQLQKYSAWLVYAIEDERRGFMWKRLLENIVTKKDGQHAKIGMIAKAPKSLSPRFHEFMANTGIIFILVTHSLCDEDKGLFGDEILVETVVGFLKRWQVVPVFTEPESPVPAQFRELKGLDFCKVFRKKPWKELTDDDIERAIEVYKSKDEEVKQKLLDENVLDAVSSLLTTCSISGEPSPDGGAMIDFVPKCNVSETLKTIKEKLIQHRVEMRDAGVVFSRTDMVKERVIILTKKKIHEGIMKKLNELFFDHEKSLIEIEVMDYDIELEDDVASFGVGSGIHCAGNRCNSVGSVGGFVSIEEPGGDGTRYIGMLTCRHVIACEECYDEVIQYPTPFLFVQDDLEAPKYVSSKYVLCKEYDMGVVFVENADQGLDMFHVVSDGNVRNIDYEVSQQLSVIGEFVQKYGSVTKLTTGKILTELDYDYVRGVRDIFVIEGDVGNFSLCGDSGSLITCRVNQNSDAVSVLGVLYAGSKIQPGKKKKTFGFRLNAALAELNSNGYNVSMVSRAEYMQNTTINMSELEEAPNRFRRISSMISMEGFSMNTELVGDSDCGRSFSSTTVTGESEWEVPSQVGDGEVSESSDEPEDDIYEDRYITLHQKVPAMPEVHVEETTTPAHMLAEREPSMIL